VYISTDLSTFKRPIQNLRVGAIVEVSKFVAHSSPTIKLYYNSKY